MMKMENVALIGEEIAIAWSDGKESYLGFETLRRACPCADCQGEPDARGRVVRPEVTYKHNSMQLVSFEDVGGYAINFKWADGHKTGLYSFDLLRRL
ncbi:DUF971 domain-containing protein [Akkermansiaceae bacterium]|nr:DUF971 domain-containing protein [Akkermansiaceae bacterium]